MHEITKSTGHDWIFFYRDGDDPEILSGSVYGLMTIEEATREARDSLEALGNHFGPEHATDYELLAVVRHDVPFQIKDKP